MRRGGGGGRQYHNTNPRPLMSMGPLVTNQDQFGLQDIDLELELLKRKREIIEKQQEMLRNEYSGESSFNLISQMYPEPRGGGYYGEGSGAGKKRPNVWDHEHESVAPKRFTSNAGPRHTYTSQSQFKSPYKPKNSQQSYQARAQSNYNSNSYKGKPKPPPAKKRTDFNPSKVTKRSATWGQAPTKLKTYAPAVAQKLVTSAMKAADKVDETLVLRADRPPSNQLAGRLGLALGALVKDIKAQFPQYEDMFKNMASHLMREMKKALRERLRVALMGKYVGGLEQITKLYREVYPPSTDREIVMRVIEKESGVDFIPVESDDPHEFFVTNMGNLMARKMDEMFAKLSDMYGIEQKMRLKAQPKDNDTTSTIVDITIEESPDTSINVDQNTSKTEEENKDKDDQSKAKDDQNKAKDDQNKAKDDQNKAKDDQNKEKKADEENKEKKKQKNEAMLQKYISMSEYQEMDRLMSAKLPIMLRKFIPQLQKLMKNDVGYRRCAAQVTKECKKKLRYDGTPTINVENEPEELADEGNKDFVVTPAKSDTPYVPLPYFVKILGRPSLPKRKQMQEFFEKYQPKSIKKHRTVHNLLFVGFNDKESYDNILKADGTQIGRFSLSIRVSERSNKPQPKRVRNNEEGDDPVVKSLNSELDEQITDLLESIKKSEGLTDGEGKQDDDVIEISDKNDVVEITEEVKEEADGGQGNNNKKEGNNENDVTVIEDSSDYTMIDDSSQDEKANLEKAVENGEKDSQQGTEIKEVDKIEPNEEKFEDNVTNIEDSETSNENGQTTQNSETVKEETQKDIEAEKKDTVSELKNAGKDLKSTPTRASARLSTPSSVRTRRASKLADNNS